MADDKTKKGGQDRTKVAGDENYEVQYEKKKTKSTGDEVKKSIAKAGNDRKKVEEDLKKKKK